MCYLSNIYYLDQFHSFYYIFRKMHNMITPLIFVLTNLNNMNFFSGIAPNFKLLVVSLCILSKAHSTHL